jgi:hypothetical protein
MEKRTAEVQSLAVLPVRLRFAFFPRALARLGKTDSSGAPCLPKKILREICSIYFQFP